MVLRDFITLTKSKLATCVKKTTFFYISFSMILMARPTLSTVATSASSEATKTVLSYARIAVAFTHSAVVVDMAEPCP